MHDVFLNVLYLYDLDIVHIDWESGEPVLSCKEDSIPEDLAKIF